MDTTATATPVIFRSVIVTDGQGFRSTRRALVPATGRALWAAEYRRMVARENGLDTARGISLNVLPAAWS